MTATTIYCISVSIDWALRQSDDHLADMLQDPDGIPYTPVEVREILQGALAEGFQVLPVCKNFDRAGRCKGHRQ